MKTRIGTSFGLVLLLALGVFATMLALGMFSPSKANADVDVSGIQLAKNTPGDNTQVTIFFSHATILAAGSGQIIATFDATWGVPSTIKREHVTLTTFQTTGGTSNPAIDPSVVIGANSTVVTITIGDTAPSTADTQNMFPNVGVVNSTPHILVFSPLAGITNPLSQGDELTSWICVTTSAEPLSRDGITFETGTACPTTGSAVPSYFTFTAPSTTGFTVPRKVLLSATGGANGTVITATGKGYVAGTLTAFLDSATAGTLGTYDSGTDTDIGTSASVVSGGTATVTFTASVPTFGVGANRINLKDGLGNIAAVTAGTLAVLNDASFSIIGSVTTSVTSVKRGESITVKLRQFFDGPVTSLTIGGAGVNVTTCCSTAIGADNAVDYTVTVPTTTPLGTQRLAVIVTGESTSSRNVDVNVVGAPLTLSPATAVIGQKITVSGSGFNASSVVSPSTGTGCSGAECIFSIAAVAIAAANIDAGATITTDNSGTMVATVTIPGTTQTSTAGTYTLQVVDSLGGTGQATLTIPSRVVTVSPASSLRSSTVTITGSGFPASTSVSFTHAGTAVGSVTADAAGAFTSTFTVPATATISNTATVVATATTTVGGVSTALTASTTHAVPAAATTISAASAAPGEKVTVSGTGFPGFASMTALTIGGVAAIPTPAPSTDTNGNFSVSVLVPSLSLGTQAVLVTVGGTTGTTSLTIVAAAVVAVVTTTATGTVFADVVANADNLVRVWRYSNATQAWAFYDPRTAFAAANTLTTTTSADIVWVNVKVQQTFQGKTLYAGWNLISLN
jgi:hypothetical protein